MVEKEFYNWLLGRFPNDNGKTACSRKSNCQRVEEFEGNLDNHYENDYCNLLINKLTYSTDDEKCKRQPRHRIPINGNKRNGTATFKSAIKLYIEFKNEIKNGNCQINQLNNAIQSKSNIPKKRQKNMTNKIIWPKWELPTEDEIYRLAQITTKYIRFLDPIIIKKITKDNIEHHKEWCDLLTCKNINPELYLWESSPCCFPGVRRYAGSKENAYLRKRIEMEIHEIPNALKLDDNDFPKQIWSFVFRGKKFGKFGPDDYSLAHLFDHKVSKNRMVEELEFNENENYNEPYFGLYTCPSNTVYIPNSLLKPTDFILTLRRLLFHKAESLYKDYCNILPPFINIPKVDNDKWDINNFQWGNCVGTLENIDTFLTFRNDFMNKLMNK